MEESRENVAQQKANERHQGGGDPQVECHDKQDALAHTDDRECYDGHTDQKSDDHPSLQMRTRKKTIRRVMWDRAEGEEAAVGIGGGKQFKKLVFEAEGKTKDLYFPFFFFFLEFL